MNSKQHLCTIHLCVWLFTSICVGCEKPNCIQKGPWRVWKWFLVNGLAGLPMQRIFSRCARSVLWIVGWYKSKHTQEGGFYCALPLRVRSRVDQEIRTWCGLELLLWKSREIINTLWDVNDLLSINVQRISELIKFEAWAAWSVECVLCWHEQI